MVGERDLSPTTFVMITNHFCQLYPKKCGSRPPLVEQEVEQTGVPNISTLEECFSLIHSILHSVKTDSNSYFCQIKV